MKNNINREKLKDIFKEFLYEQYSAGDDALDIIDTVTTFLSEQMYKYDPPQEVLDDLEMKVASALSQVENDIRVIVNKEWKLTDKYSGN